VRIRCAGHREAPEARRDGGDRDADHGESEQARASAADAHEHEDHERAAQDQRTGASYRRRRK
jgi:hypothetical protein